MAIVCFSLTVSSYCVFHPFFCKSQVLEYNTTKKDPVTTTEPLKTRSFSYTLLLLLQVTIGLGGSIREFYFEYKASVILQSLILYLIVIQKIADNI